MIEKDYYQILGVAKTADSVEIKKAYKKLAIQYHPDRNPGNAEAEEKFKEASEAYQVLSDSEKRSIYDRFGHEGLRGRGFSGVNDFGDIFSSMGSIFEEFFGGFGGARPRNPNAPSRGRDLRYDLEIDLEEAAFGVDKAIKVQKYATCLTCKGSGAKAGTSPVACPTCQGSGYIRRSSGFFSLQSTCPSCNGAGKVIREKCETCSGAGQVVETSNVNVKIPAGIDSGMKLRVSGAGEDGRNGGPAGDLYVVVYTRDHQFLERHQNDLVMRLPISMIQATLGGEQVVPTLDGETTVKIPKGTQPGDVLRVKGKGVPHLKGYGRGDLLVEAHIQIPRSLNKKQEELLRQFAEMSGEELANSKHSFLDKLKNLASGD